MLEDKAILIVEDEPLIAAMLEDLLGDLCQITLKVSPLEACAEVPGPPRLSWSGLLGRGDFGGQCASVDEVVRRGF